MINQDNTIVVTGAAGYIGGQIALRLADAGQKVLGIDRRPCHSGVAAAFAEFVQDDFASDEALSKLIEAQPSAIIHCAGTSLVGPSIMHPSDYYKNNVAKTMALLDIVRHALPRTRFIFSSSAAVYGEPIMNPCHEVDPCEPISPYGESKRMVEQILESYHKAYGLDYVAFRYFNACGADPQGRHGQEAGATHLIARLLEATRDNGIFKICGVDYPTDDGTCVRDYVHVNDIAYAHILALNPNVKSGVYNLAGGTGTSVKQVIEQAMAVTGKQPAIEFGAARAGDPAVLTASSDKFDRAVEAEWRTHNLTDMIKHSWSWYVR
jgi:UDP-glucose 4-epimerase